MSEEKPNPPNPWQAITARAVTDPVHTSSVSSHLQMPAEQIPAEQIPEEPVGSAGTDEAVVDLYVRSLETAARNTIEDPGPGIASRSEGHDIFQLKGGHDADV